MTEQINESIAEEKVKQINPYILKHGSWSQTLQKINSDRYIVTTSNKWVEIFIRDNRTVWTELPSAEGATVKWDLDRDYSPPDKDEIIIPPIQSVIFSGDVEFQANFSKRVKKGVHDHNICMLIWEKYPQLTLDQDETPFNTCIDWIKLRGKSNVQPPESFCCWEEEVLNIDHVNELVYGVGEYTNDPAKASLYSYNYLLEIPFEECLQIFDAVIARCDIDMALSC